MRTFCRFCSRVSVRRAPRAFQMSQLCASHTEAATAIRRKECAR
jgi:hypothetical protein